MCYQQRRRSARIRGRPQRTRQVRPSESPSTSFAHRQLRSAHVLRTIARSTSSRSLHNITANVSTLVTGLLISDLTDLISIGCLTLCAKLAPALPALPLSDEKFLARLTELWSFCKPASLQISPCDVRLTARASPDWTGVCPHLDAVFWVLRCDERLKASVGGTGREREREGRTLKGEGRIDVRKLALIGFRDHLILPNIDRITQLFRELYESRPPSRRMSGTDTPPHPAPPSNAAPSSHSAPTPSHRTLPSYSSASTILPPITLHPAVGPFPTAGSLQQIQAANARRRQMVAILASVLTNDQVRPSSLHQTRSLLITGLLTATDRDRRSPPHDARRHHHRPRERRRFLGRRDRKSVV